MGKPQANPTVIDPTPPPAAPPAPTGLHEGAAEQPVSSRQAELSVLDEDLARQAEQTIQTAGDDFDLEGDFLTQDQIAQIVEESAGRAGSPAHPPAAADAPQPEPVAKAAAALSVAPAEPDPPPAAPPASPQPPAPAVASLAQAAQSVVTPPAPAEQPQLPPQPAAEPPAKQPAIGSASPPPMAPPPPAGKPQPDTPPPAPVPAAQAGGEQPAGEPRRGLFHWPGRVAFLLADLLDTPFRRVPLCVKNILGAVGAAIFVAAVGVWALSFFL